MKILTTGQLLNTLLTEGEYRRISTERSPKTWTLKWWGENNLMVYESRGWWYACYVAGPLNNLDYYEVELIKGLW